MKSFAPVLSGVFRESSRTVCFLPFSRIVFELCECAKWIGRRTVVIVKPLQNFLGNGIFGHPTWNAFPVLLPISWLLNDKTYRRVITRNGPVPQILKDMGVAVKISRLNHR